MLNKWIGVGRLGSDLEVKTSAGGANFATVNMAVNENRKTDEGWETETTWVSLVFFGKNAETAAKVLQKGDLISVEAKYSKRQFTTKEGQKAYSHSFVVSQWSRLLKSGGGSGVESDVADELDDEETDSYSDAPF